MNDAMTLTTEQVRRMIGVSAAIGLRDWGAEFDRWLVEHDRAVAAAVECWEGRNMNDEERADLHDLVLGVLAEELPARDGIPKVQDYWLATSLTQRIERFMAEHDRLVAAAAWYEGVAATGVDESLLNIRNPHDYVPESVSTQSEETP